jgi:hypothetical protein
VHSYKVGLQLLLQSIEEPLRFLLIGVDVIGCIPSPGGELVKILGDTHSSLLQIEELIPHNLDESRGNVGLAELGLECFPGHHLPLATRVMAPEKSCGV